MSETPPKLTIHCPDRCSLHPDKIGPGATAILRIMRENGAGAIVLQRRAAEVLGYPVQVRSVSRHLNHYREIDNDAPPLADGEQAGDLDILNRIIQQAAKNSGSWKPTIRDALEAMKLKAQLTGNSIFEDMISAMDGALNVEFDENGEPVEAENPEAVAAPEERPEEEEPLGEPAL